MTDDVKQDEIWVAESPYSYATATAEESALWRMAGYQHRDTSTRADTVDVFVHRVKGYRGGEYGTVDADEVLERIHYEVPRDDFAEFVETVNEAPSADLLFEQTFLGHEADDD